MTPSVFRILPDQRKLEEQIERQMGCLTGFLQLFDRSQILTGKHLYPTKRLPSSLNAGSSSPSERSEFSTMSLAKEVPLFSTSSSPERYPSSPETCPRTESPRRHTLPLPVFELKDGLKTSWKLREAPRLSLDSRANVDAKGKLRPREIQSTPFLLSGNLSDASGKGENREKRGRSPSVVARLMGLEVLPGTCSGEPPARAELRRSASESRVSRDMSQFNFQESSPMPFVFGPRHDYCEARSPDTKAEAPRPPLISLQRKSFFHSQEHFPEPKHVESLYSDIEKRLRMRGIEEPAKDLETLKQILEALQLKGLLHSKAPEQQDCTGINVARNRRPRTYGAGQSPIVVMKPVPKPPQRLTGNHYSTPLPRSVSPHRPQVQESMPSTRARRDQNLRIVARQNPRSPEPSLALRNPSGSPARRRPLSAEGQGSPAPQRRIPVVNSPKSNLKRLGSSPVGQPNRRPTVDIPRKNKIYSLKDDDTSAHLSGTTIISPSSQFEIERTRTEYSPGRSLLERCDKLLHSIAAISTPADQVTPTDRQPSPVSVLDSTFLSDECLPSPLLKRTINFSDQLTDWDEDRWNNQSSSTSGSSSSPGPQAETTEDKGDDYAYVADVVRESDLNGSVADAFAAIESRHQSSITPPLHRRLVFDAAFELVNRKRRLAPWDAFYGVVALCSGSSLMDQVWEELCRIREHVVTEDVMEVTCAVIRKDIEAALDGEHGWGVSGEEMSHAVLHIERQVFKDLVADTIRELADLAGRCRRTAALSRRKLHF